MEPINKPLKILHLFALAVNVLQFYSKYKFAKKLMQLFSTKSYRWWNSNANAFKSALIPGMNKNNFDEYKYLK